MKKKLKFVWVDDNPARKKDSENLSSQLDITVDFLDLKGQPIDERLHHLAIGSEPDLIILDHSLDQALSETYKTGSTAATFLHEQWPECPIVSFTGVDLNDIDIRHKSAYEGMYPINRISEYYKSILSIATGFNLLKNNRPSDITSLLSKFKVPEDDQEKFKKILPKELKENFDDKSLLSEIYRWSRSILFKRPGFLYDRVWAATYLGLSEKGFGQVEKSFDKAKYQGVFSDASNERWWKSKLLEIVGEKTQEVGLPWVIGRKLVDVNKQNFSKCYSSNEDFPETVAAEDMTPGARWKAMKLKYTEPHPNFEDMLFFEELRLMKPA